MMTPIRKTYGLATLLSLGLAVASHSASAACTYKISNEWNTGLTGEITVTNSGSSAVNGWSIGWQYNTNRLSGSWNANVSGSNPYTASNLSWNGNLQPGQSATFGFQVDKRGGSAEIPAFSGSICSGTQPTSSSAPSSVTVTSSSRPSSSSSAPVVSGEQCNWYGTLYPVCTSTQSGWGYENNKSCISRSTCAGQPAPYGIVGNTSSTSTPSSSARPSSVASSITTSSSRSSSSTVTSSSVAVTSSSRSSSSAVVPSSSSVVTSSSRSSSSAVVVSSSRSSSSAVVTSSSRSSTNSSVGPRLDNPFVDARWYIDPVWSGKAQAEIGGSKVANYNTAVWMDRIGAIEPTDGSYGLRDHLDAAIAQNANVIQVVVYDLPNRDCKALASNGELKQGVEGSTRYRTEYVDKIVSIFSDPKYASLRIIAIIEPDSLPNLVTNLNDPDCQAATDPTYGYIANTRYTLSKLYPLTNVYSYVDIGHSGWLGWDDNFGKAVTLIGDAIKGATGGVNSIAGFVSNTAGYTPLYEPFLDSLANSAFPGSGGGTQTRQAAFFEWNPYFSEVAFVQAWRTRMIAAGFPSTIGMLIDTSRNGWGGVNRPTAQSTSTVLDTFVNQSRIDKRTHRGNWCNQKGGIGERPQAAPAAGIDAYVWVKPPGESDGAASQELSYDPQDPAKGFDRMCDPTYTYSAGNLTVETGAMANAPVAGRWFKEGFLLLLNNAYPAAQ